MINQIKILSEPSIQNPYVIVYKPKGIPSAPLSLDDTNNVYSQVAQKFPELDIVIGKKEIEHGLIHRLDTVTDGLLVITSTQQAYDFFIEQQSIGNFIKFYSAECKINKQNSEILEGFPKIDFDLSKDFFTISSFFRTYKQGGKEVRPVIENSSKFAKKKMGKLKEYSTNVQILQRDCDTVKVECSIKQGFKHQVRCHLAWIGLPIINDCVYNKESLNENKEICFSATKLKFVHPITKEIIEYEYKE
ncbi:MAG: RNA pseudouridine synthase [Treponema bryantii]|nr:RNA pseudouridine synthase [Treponema bryantii]